MVAVTRRPCLPDLLDSLLLLLEAEVLQVVVASEAVFAETLEVEIVVVDSAVGAEALVEEVGSAIKVATDLAVVEADLLAVLLRMLHLGLEAAAADVEALLVDSGVQAE